MWLVAEGSIKIDRVESISLEKSYTSLDALRIEGVLESGNKVEVTLSPEYTYIHLTVWFAPSAKFEFALHSFRYEVGFKTYKDIKMYGKDVSVKLKFKRMADFALAQRYFEEFWKNWMRRDVV